MERFDKVFGVGLNKTGTRSLEAALRHLGFDHLGWDPSLLQLHLGGETAELLRISESYESFTDWPWPLIVRDLLDHYGNRARFILTTRKSPEIWLRSLDRHAAAGANRASPRRQIYGHDRPRGREASFQETYLAHINRVRQLFAERGLSDLLLEVSWDSGDGWQQLAPFLSCPVPSGNFPHRNKSKAKASAFDAAQRRSA